MASKSEKVSDGFKNNKCQKALNSELEMSNGLEIKKQVPNGFKIKAESVNGVKIKEGGGWLQNQRWKCRKALQSKMNRKASNNKSKCRMASKQKRESRMVQHPTIPTGSSVIANGIIVKRTSEPDATRKNLVASASQVAVSSVEE